MRFSAAKAVPVVFFFLLAAIAIPAKADQPGEALFKAKCATCHGPDGKGDTSMGKMLKANDFASDEVKKMSDADLTDAIAKGKGKMPAYKTLTPEQIKDLVAYVRTFAKK